MRAKASRPRLVDFCSGAGLMSEGFRRAGFEPVLAIDSDPHAVDSYRRNVGRRAEVGDVARSRPRCAAEILIAGPPCQGFSTLGKRDEADPRNLVGLAIAEWAEAIRPKAIVVENVSRFLTSRQYVELRRRLTRLGFEAEEWELDAADYGVPQRRVRAFAVFYVDEAPRRPSPAPTRLTVGDAFRALPSGPADDVMNYSPVPGPLALERFRRIPSGGDKRDLVRTAPQLCPPSWLKLGAQATDVWGRMHLDRPANTIRCCFQNASKGRYIHPREDRVISLREGARIQGVPDEWRFSGRPQPIARQIGNGVPIPLAEAVAKSLREAIS